MAVPTTDAKIEIARLPAGFNRWEELRDLIRRTFAYMDGVIDPPSSAHRLTPRALREKCNAETVLIALSDGSLVGCIFLADRGDHVYVGKLAVEPALQGRGIGRRLMQAAEAEALRQGKRVIELQTRIELTGNHAAFGRLGFRETGRTAHEGFSRPTSITMRKELRP
jgi:predicted N-acetyltransferase YhbS